ncbi:MAG: hypothetical protein ACI841_003377 [Planctomycetota bacterium]|jgi:hypothetical protein
MSQDRVRYELESLSRACQSVQEHVTRLRNSARYAKSPERVEKLVLEVQAMREKLEQATQVAEDAVLDASGDTQDSPLAGWLRRRLNRMATTIASGAEPEPVPGPRRIANPGSGGFHGDSWTIALPGLLSFLESQRKSGQLHVKLEAEAITLDFDHGVLVLAVSDKTPVEQRLGAMLVAQGVVTQKRLESFLACFRSSTRRLGEALLQGELVDHDSLCKALDQQAQLLFERMIVAKGAQYVFRDGKPELATAGPRINITRLLLESVRAMDERGESAA